MKLRYKNILFAAALLGLTGCNGDLDVQNPNGFSDDDITEKILNGTDEAKKKMVLEGMVNNMQNYILSANAAFANGFSNSEQYEYNQELWRSLQVSDMVEGSEVYKGSWVTYYTNDEATLQWWNRDQAVSNYGYYLGPVYRISAALHPLLYINKTDSVALAKDQLLRQYRAQCNTIKALGYIQLMERYTDMQDVNSTTKQGWPIYDEWKYNNPKQPLSVKATWDWIKTTLKQCVADFKFSALGTEGYTVAKGSDDDNIHDIDCGVAQYELARTGLDTKDYALTIAACEDILKHYPNLISADNYGMKASLLKDVNSRNDNGWNGTTFNADQNAFFNIDKNPEAMWGTKRGGSSCYFGNLNPLFHSMSSWYQVDANIYNKLSDNDCRKACILPSDFENFNQYSTQAGKTDTTWYKYTMPKYTSLKFAASEGIGYANHSHEATTSDLVYMRASTVRLMLAEAYAQSNQEAKAKEQLNILLAARTLPGKPTMTCDNTMQGMTVMDMVKLQWRIETWGEADWAFYNCKRWNEVPARGANQWSKNAIAINRMTWEIPTKEHQGNGNWAE